MRIFFQEKQRFTQWWLWIIIFLSCSLFYLPYKADEDIPFSLTLLSIAIPLFFYLFELRTFVTKKGLYYQFFPFHFKKYLIKIEEIEEIEALEYKPISDYGGWGIKYGFKGKAYNVSGNKGVKIHLKNKRHILFGSQKHNEFAKSLKNIRKQ